MTEAKVRPQSQTTNGSTVGFDVPHDTLNSLFQVMSSTDSDRQTATAFLSRVGTPTRDIDIVILSVRPPVRGVLVSDETGLTYCHSFFIIR